VDGASWPDLEPSQCDQTCTFKFQTLDSLLAGVYQDNQTNGTNNVVEFTLARTPKWAQPANPPDKCGPNNGGPNYPYSCYPPTDLNADGTGTNAFWRNWVWGVANHVHNLGSGFAQVKYWEIWNEFNGGQGNFWAGAIQDANLTTGTTNQLIRMAEDANCIITGRVQTISFTNETCSQVLQSLIPPQAQSVDPTAKIVMPSLAGPVAAAASCFLYCNTGSNGCGTFDNHDRCTAGSNGASAVDILDAHYYGTTANPESGSGSLSTAALRAVLQPNEQAKPLWIGEGSFGNTLDPTLPPGEPWWLDAYAQGGFIPRYFATIWSQTLPHCTGSNCAKCDWSSQLCQQAFWYGYDFDKKTATKETPGSIGALYCAGSDSRDPHTCNDGNGQNGIGILVPPNGPTPMWQTGVAWLTGAQMPANATTFCQLATSSSTVWHCDFTKNGSSYSMVWDNKYSAQAQGNANYCAASFPSSPYVCGNTSYPISPQYTHWQDLGGTNHSITETVPLWVGLNPILLEP